MSPSPTEGGTVTVHLPLVFRRIGGRKEIVTPDGTVPWVRPAAQIDDPILLALAKAWRWQRQLDEGTFATITEIAQAEGISAAHAGRILSLTVLAPDIVKAILDGHLSERIGVNGLISVARISWPGQQTAFQT